MDLLPLKIAGAQPNTVHKFIGLAFGFPVAVRVARQAKATLGAYMHVRMPPLLELDDVQGVERRVGFSFTMRVAESVGTSDTSCGPSLCPRRRCAIAK